MRGDNPARHLVEILIIDDSPADIVLLKSSLSADFPDLHISVICDGKEGLDFLGRVGRYVEAPRPDLVFLDLNMPGMDGLDVLRSIKENPRLRGIPVLMISGSQAQDDVNRAYDLHANGYVCKPANLDELCELVSAVGTFWFSFALRPNGVSSPVHS